MTNERTETSRERLRARAGEESGVALIMTLLLLALLLVLILDLSYDARINLRLVTNNRDADQMRYAIRGEVEKARSILAYDSNEGDIDSTQDEWAQSGLADSYNDVQVTLTIEDEARKFNILWLLEPEPEAKRNTRERRQRSREIDEETGADKTTTGRPEEDAKKKRERAEEMLTALIDEFRGGTAYDLSEGDAKNYVRAISDYLNRGRKGRSASIPPFPTTDGHPITVDEILLAPGISEDILYDSVDETTGEIVPGLVHFVTIWSEGALNVNTAPEVVLRCLFDEKERDKARDIVEYRASEPEDSEARDELEKKRRQDERKRREKRERDERRLGRALPDRPLDGEEEEYDPRKTVVANQVFEGSADLRKNNLLDDDDLKKIEPWITFSSRAFSAYVTASRGTSERRVRVILRRDEDGNVLPVLWEERRDARLFLGEKTREERLEEEAENGEDLFGGGGGGGGDDDDLFR